ncbi:hypothetical protein BDB01DRAFT_269949 [Pilobolus umbonatus]|nr:hypothetical protein BDB01DRAFT_269949 [Pilobolus umbonatus]
MNINGNILIFISYLGLSHIYSLCYIMKHTIYYGVYSTLWLYGLLPANILNRTCSEEKESRISSSIYARYYYPMAGYVTVACSKWK